MWSFRWHAVAIAAVTVLQSTAPATTPGAALIVDGFARLDVGRLDEARALFEKALAIGRDEKIPRIEAHALRGFGRYWAQHGDPAAARDALDRSMTLFEALNDQTGIAQVWNQRGTNAFYQRQWQEADAAYRQALSAFERAGLPGEEANILRNLTFVPTLSVEERLRLIAIAVDRAVAAKQPALEGLALHNWGDLLVQTTDYLGAMKKLEAARVLIDAHGAPVARARLYTSLGRTYRLHGEPALALPYYERALQWQQAARDEAGQAQTLNAMALANLNLRRTKTAQSLYERALESAQRSGAPGQISFTRQQFGIFLATTGQAARGAALLEEELGAAEITADRVPVLSALSKAYVVLKRYAKAESAADEAVTVASRSQDLEARRLAHHARAEARRAAGRPAAALDDARQMLQLIERSRPTLAQADALRLGYGERMRNYFDFAVSLFAEAGLPEEAFVASEQGRARAVLDLLASQNLRLTSEAPSLDALRRTSARLDSTVLSYWVTERQTFVFLVGRDGAVRCRAIAVTSAHLDDLVGRTALGWAPMPGTAGTRGPGAAATAAPQDRLVLDERAGAPWRELYDLLILPIRRWIPAGGGHLLTILPDASLNRLSFAALRNERGRYLLEGYRLHFISALSVLDYSKGQGMAPPAPERILVVANPAVMRDSAATASLVPLPGALREAAAIARRSPSGAVVVLSGRDATEARVRGEAPARTVLHFAAHSVVRDDRPMESFLALAPGAGEPANDGFLTAKEIYGLDLGASLVVLSACRSGGGRITGDGIIGLTRAFVSAGVPSVVASVWDLPDETAPWLFERFYVARARLPADGALRAAQLELLAALRAGTFTIETAAGAFVVPEHPAVWAGLQLWGEPR